MATTLAQTCLVRRSFRENEANRKLVMKDAKKSVWIKKQADKDLATITRVVERYYRSEISVVIKMDPEMRRESIGFIVEVHRSPCLKHKLISEGFQVHSVENDFLLNDSNDDDDGFGPLFISFA